MIGRLIAVVTQYIIANRLTPPVALGLEPAAGFAESSAQ